MRVSLAVVVALSAALAVPRGAAADDHLVTRQTVQERLQGAAEARQADLDAVLSVLSRPEAAAAANAVGSDARKLKAAAATLTDAELDDLAQRARALRADPVAGLSGDVNQLLVIFLIVAIVILVLKAV